MGEVVEGVVTFERADSRFFYAWCREFAQETIVIPYEYCPQGVSLLGKWVRMRLDRNFRACEVVFTINDLFPTRIANGLVEVKVEIRHDGNYCEKFEMFDHNYFGFICDPRHVISNVEQGALYTVWLISHREEGVHSRWRLSTKQDCARPQPRKIETSNDHGNFEGLQLVEGIIHSYAKTNDSYFAWSKIRPKSTIRVDFSFCPPRDLLGVWVEMEIDDKNRVQRNVRVLRDCLETRVKAGVAEIRIDFQHINRIDNMFEMFYHQYFGNICDCKMVMNNVKNGAWYNGWIVYHKQERVPALWRLATMQNVEGPLNRRDRVLSPARSIRRRSPDFSQSMSHFHDEHDRASLNHEYPNQNFSGRNYEEHEYRAPSGCYERGSRNGSPRRLKSASMNNQQHFSRNHSPARFTYERRRSRSVDRPYSRRVDSFPEDASNGHQNLSANHRRGGSMNEQREFDDSPPSHSSELHVQSRFDTEAPQHSRKSSQTSDRSGFERANDVNQMNNLGSNSTNSTSRQKTSIIELTEKEKEISELKMKLDRIGDIVAFFNSNETIRQSLRRMDIEQYDELIELMKTAD